MDNQTPPDVRVDEARASMYEAKAKAESEKHSIEFSRYKQDCRKRALDIL